MTGMTIESSQCDVIVVFPFSLLIAPSPESQAINH